MKTLIAALALATLAAFAGGEAAPARGSFEISFPEDQDTYIAFDGLTVNGEGKELLIEFEGSIGPDGKSIRATWRSGDGSKKDDFVLKKYKPGDASFVYRASKSLANLDFGSNQYRLIATFADGSTKEVELTLYVIHGHMGEKAKPVIYLYPPDEREVSVRVSPAGGVTTSIPAMGGGWKVRARPDGSLFDMSTGKAYPYLFWESKDYGPPIDRSEGFVVARESLGPWLSGKLAYLGLEPREIRDFSDYWLPILSSTPYTFLRFYPRERIDREAPLEVSPAPDTLIRVFFEHVGLDAPVPVREQALEAGPRRAGFSVVEWGGRRE
jgi:hypothetical protein